MEPNRIGRILGIGTRVAADKLRERTAHATAPANRPAASASVAAPKPATSAPQSAAPAVKVPSGAAFAEGSRRFARGAGRFGSSLWRPFAHATGILTLQITGLFFALFTLVFAVHSWQLYKADGWRDRHLPLYVFFGVLFFWFAVSSFWRARRKQKQ
jgi:hypothetical protein